eukprot:Anaeramoba_flamelloidesa1068998_41.p1 GENE.a1068998_41~~a1068998_41.p1  ORF type:complete len:632 (-),score=171.06 a1068998_41:11-1906(-)
MEQLNISQYSYHSTSNGKKIILSTSNDLILGKTLSVRQRVQWLIRHDRFDEALTIAQANPKQLGKEFTVKQLGKDLLEYLFITRDFDKLSQKLPLICKNDQKLWEYWILVFLRSGKLKLLSNCIPIESPQLNPTIYEMLLCLYIKIDHKLFRKLINKWPLTIYNPQNVINLLKIKIKNEENNLNLKLALAEIFEEMESTKQAIDLYLETSQKKVFELISENNLYYYIQNKIKFFVEADEEKSLEVLIKHYKQIPIRKVVKQLQDYNEKRLFLLQYLERLYELKISTKSYQYYDVLFELFAEYRKGRLYELLKDTYHQNISLNLNSALLSCRRFERHAECVYILWKMGKTNEALDLVMNKLGDISQAIELVQSEDDPSLWKELVKICMNHSKHLAYLLKTLVNTKINYLSIVKKIPLNTNIIDLSNSLGQIIHDEKIKTELITVTSNIVKKDSTKLMNKLHNNLVGSTYVESNQICSICNDPMKNFEHEKGIFFFCGHSFHESCIRYNLESLQLERENNLNDFSNSEQNNNLLISRNFGDGKQLSNKQKRKKHRLKKKKKISLYAKVRSDGEVVKYVKGELNLRDFIKVNYDKNKVKRVKKQNLQKEKTKKFSKFLKKSHKRKNKKLNKKKK